MGKIRIISGYLRGQIIHTIKHHTVKPTMHRIRETLFNWLSYKIQKKKCLDCFSGSGALSIESISRYAKYVTLLEKERKNIYNIKKNAVRLKIKNINIIHIDAIKWLKKTQNKYDIIFLDPPYHSDLLQESISLIYKNDMIQPDGYIYVEKHRLQKIQYPKKWTLCKYKNTNNVNYQLYIFKINNNTSISRHL